MKDEFGAVYLIGAGPGDPGLFTIKGQRILSAADVVVYDYLVNTKLLEYTNPSAEIIYVGKKAGQKERSQEDINNLLINTAKQGKNVARLKGGDPFVFGRGGEEAKALWDEGIPFEIVPGITSVSAVPAYAGIPLTHRDINSSFAVVTGHEDPTKDESNIPWDSLSVIDTVVILMGMKNLSYNMNQLIKAGKPEDTPVGIVSWGTYPMQSVITGTVGTIEHLAQQRDDIDSPAVVIIGNVVKLREFAAWYERKPLFGKTVLVTRAKEQSETFVRLLEDMAARVIEFPTIEIVPPPSFTELDNAIEDIGLYSWLIFTSVNGVNSFFDRFSDLERDIRDLYGIKLAAIGQKTAEAVQAKGIRVEIVPEDYKAEGLISKFEREDLKGRKILIPRAKVARDILPEMLRAMGAKVDVVTSYISKRPDNGIAKNIRSLIDNKKIDVITFTSSSTAENFFNAVGDIKRLSTKTVIACIGPITASTVRSLGYEPKIVSREYTVENLTNEITQYFANK